MAISSKITHVFTFDSAIPLLGICPKNILAKIRQDARTKLCTEAPFVIVKHLGNSNVHQYGLVNHTEKTLQLENGKRRISRCCDNGISRVQH